MTVETAALTGALVDLVDEIDFAGLPVEAVETAKAAILDGVGVALAGYGEEAAGVVLRHARAAYAGGAASILGADLRLAPIGAALVNGTLVHALDFDDTAWSYIGHPTAVILPAALAAGEHAGASGRELIAAYVAGFEVASRVGRPVAEILAERGWHLTSTVGVLGAAAAAGKLLGLTGRRLAQTLGAAATQAAGLKANFGWNAKPFHAGMAARSGVESAQLVDAGLSASPCVLDDRLGFFAAFTGAEPATQAQDGLAILGDGIAFKRYPSCTGTHAVIDALLALCGEHGIRPEDVELVTCGTTPEVPSELLHPFPDDADQARFSMNFAAAVALAEGAVELEHFSEEVLAQPLIRELMARCELVVDPRLDRPPAVRTPAALVEVRLTSGATVARRVDSAKGNPQNPLAPEELAAKFRACAARRLRDDGQVRALQETLLHLEELADVEEIATVARPRTRPVRANRRSR